MSEQNPKKPHSAQERITNIYVESGSNVESTHDIVTTTMELMVGLAG